MVHNWPASAALHVSWPSQSWSSVENLGFLDTEVHLLLHCSLDRGSKKTDGDSTQKPQCSQLPLGYEEGFGQT